MDIYELRKIYGCSYNCNGDNDKCSTAEKCEGNRCVCKEVGHDHDLKGNCIYTGTGGCTIDSCGTNKICAAGSNQCEECLSGYHVDNNNCVECILNTHCVTSKVCDSTNKRCVECTNSDTSKCNPGQICDENNQCTDDTTTIVETCGSATCSSPQSCQMISYEGGLYNGRNYCTAGDVFGLPALPTESYKFRLVRSSVRPFVRTFVRSLHFL